MTYTAKIVFINKTTGKESTHWLEKESDLKLVQPVRGNEYHDYWQINGISEDFDFKCNNYFMIKKRENLFL